MNRKQTDTDDITRPTLSEFDRMKGSLHGLPDVITTKQSTLDINQPFGFGNKTWILQTYRQANRGDTIFLQSIDQEGSMQLVIPPVISDAIARQRDSLTGKSRSRASKRVAADRKAQGHQPGFMKGKGGK